VSCAFVLICCKNRYRNRDAGEEAGPRGEHNSQGEAVCVRPQFEGANRILRFLYEKVSPSVIFFMFLCVKKDWQVNC
jgi:hypothetical protein